MIIAGPCSAESESQVLETAVALKQLGVSVFRSGIWKPRTHPGCFEGMGTRALPWLRRVKDELGMSVCTEVATKEHVEACLDAGVDMMWIGARTTSNPFLVQEIAETLKGVKIPVLVKNPINPDLELWIGAIERLRREGIEDIGVVHRGFSTFEHSKFRNAPYWRYAIELRTTFPELPFFCDPSHMAGSTDFIREISQHALDLGLDGLMIETHCHPECALSDASQQLTPSALGELLKALVVRYGETASGAGNDPDMLEGLRLRIGAIDSELVRLLGERMKVSREIGKFKKLNNMSILQTAQWDRVRNNAVRMAAENALDEGFINRLFSLVHEESIAEQNKILEGPHKRQS